jgi:ADP-heptose:LPS heptosyltransferase
LGSFIVGFSGAQFRVGIQGKWDRWFNLRFPRPAEKNKYRSLAQLIGSMGLQAQKVFPTLALSSKEREAGRQRLEKIMDHASRPTVGVFVGGRKARAKRWPEQNFLELAAGLRRLEAHVVVFAGPEERELIRYFQQRLRERAPVVFEPEVRRFASMVAACDLFVTCDSSPMHLACALRVRTVALFLKRNFDRWGPPAELARIVYRDAGITVEDVLDACVRELMPSSVEEKRRKIVNA